MIQQKEKMIETLAHGLDVIYASVIALPKNQEIIGLYESAKSSVEDGGYLKVLRDDQGKHTLVIS